MADTDSPKLQAGDYVTRTGDDLHVVLRLSANQQRGLFLCVRPGGGYEQGAQNARPPSLFRFVQR